PLAGVGVGALFALMPATPMIWNQSFWNQSSWTPVAQNPNSNTPMAEPDLTNITVDQTWIDELNTKADALLTHLLTKAVSLTDEQRRKHKGIGPENGSMVDDGVALIRDNAGWFPGTFNRAKLLADVPARELWLQGKSKIMQVHELYFDTLQAVSCDIVQRVRKGRPFIEASAELTGMSNIQVGEYLDWFKRFGGPDEEEEPTPPPTPPIP
ncbi:MAG: hypothetical protein ABMA13_21675, partial [Chthoniobacteraceae bacterium]